MLIPNKFNGYSADGIRKYHIDGGIGEAALLGAAMGGGSAAITGGDPLKGALLGGLTGGAMSGIGGAIGGAAPVTDTVASTAGANTGIGALPAGTNNVASNIASQVTNGAGAAGGTGGASSGFFPIGGSAESTLTPSSIESGLGTAGYGANQGALSSGFFDASTVGNGANAGVGAVNAQNVNIPPSAAAPAADTAGQTSFQKAMANPTQYIKDNAFKMGASALAGATGARKAPYSPAEYNGPLKRFRLSKDYKPSFAYAEGGITDLADGGTPRTNYTDMLAHGGIADLGSYSDGGRMLRGPGDGMSDSIPATIGNKRPARLAEGEFVVPADVVSHLGNGSTDAGAKQLYAMMNKVRQARTGTKAQGKEINPGKYMPV
jgi:hypothetical protein